MCLFIVHRQIESDHVYEGFYENENLFGSSDYREDSKIFDSINKKVIGKIKDEVKEKIISEFVGLKSKMYSLVTVNNKEIKKAKNEIKMFLKALDIKEYIDVLFNKNLIRHKMKRIQIKLHRIGTYDVCKNYMPCSDDKKYILGDGINSLAYFHKDERTK